MHSQLLDILVIGGGPAGVSAALYTARAGLSTTIVYKDCGALKKAETIDNFYGCPGASGADLVKSGLLHAANVGATVVEGEAVKVSTHPIGDGLCFVVETTESIFTAKAVLLATGVNRQTPNIPGLGHLEGKGVSHCAVCDAFFYKNKDVAVLGHSQYALSEAKELQPIAKSVHVLTNGQEPDVDFPEDISIHKDVVREVAGEKKLSGVAFEGDGNELPVAGLFIALGSAGATDLARKIGAYTENNLVIVDGNMRTNIPGLWAAGDCTPGMKQIAKAVYDGAVAGTDMTSHIRAIKDKNKKSTTKDEVMV